MASRAIPFPLHCLSKVDVLNLLCINWQCFKLSRAVLRFDKNFMSSIYLANFVFVRVNCQSWIVSLSIRSIMITSQCSTGSFNASNAETCVEMCECSFNNSWADVDLNPNEVLLYFKIKRLPLYNQYCTKTESCSMLGALIFSHQNKRLGIKIFAVNSSLVMKIKKKISRPYNSNIWDLNLWFWTGIVIS